MSYEEEENQDLIRAGFNPNSLTKNQKYLILMPYYGPENFYQDGELTHAEAMSWWKQRMRNEGLSTQEIIKAVNFNF